MGVENASSGANEANEFDAAETKGGGFGPPGRTVVTVVLFARQIAVNDVETGLGTLKLSAIRVWPRLHNGCKRDRNVVSVLLVEKILHFYVA